MNGKFYAYLEVNEEEKSMKILNGITFLETKDIRKALKIGNQTCLDLFHQKDFPAKKIGKSWLVMEESFKDYFKSKNIASE